MELNLDLKINNYSKNMIWLEEVLTEVKLKKFNEDNTVSCNVKEFTENLFGFYSKKANKLTLNNIHKNSHINMKLFYLTFLLSNKLSLNKDLIFNKIEIENTYQKYINLNHIKVNQIKSLLKLFPEKRVIDLLFENDNEWEFLNDIKNMINNIQQKNKLHKISIKKPKSILEIHDKLNILCKKLDQKDFDLCQKEDIIKLDNTEINNDLIIKVPKTHYDLVELGEYLNFCIGNGYYSNQVKNGKCSIVAIFDKNKKAKYGIQFNRFTIKQAYGFGNTRIPKDILIDIENKLISLPEVPDDFISVDHSFINGYKYDNKDLYVMFKNGNIYIYHDLDNDTYNEFITAKSRGSFFSREIKPNFDCSKIN